MSVVQQCGYACKYVADQAETIAAHLSDLRGRRVVYGKSLISSSLVFLIRIMIPLDYQISLLHSIRTFPTSSQRWLS